MSSKKEYPTGSQTPKQQYSLDEAARAYVPRSKTRKSPVETDSFHRQASADPYREAEAFFDQMAFETGAPIDIYARMAKLKIDIKCERFSSLHTKEELKYGTGLAWRNSVRCVGRMFWPSLKFIDARDCNTEADVFDAILHHLEWATNGGDLRSAITVFRPGTPEIRILNPQLILYAGYEKADGSVIGDPKNVQFTKFARARGWTGKGTRFDILPLFVRIGDAEPQLFEIPEDRVLEVRIRHPEFAAFENLDLKWFALPAVASMALDMGGVVYPGAPTSGIYQGTEIASVNFGDPTRYNLLPQVAEAIGLKPTPKNPLWKDQALVELNRAVLHSFHADGVRILDHHTLSESFKKFYDRETFFGRDVHGHWPWIVPPMSSNLSWIWHEPNFKKVILKPGYFYQSFPADLIPPKP
ncbi:MAG: nitric oxide synthase oxygenase [Pseudomonadota bacterium]